MRFASLGSGSEGNALVVEVADESGVCRVMLDCGFGLKEVEARLARLAIAPASLAAIVITHVHGDHIGGVFRLARRYDVAVWASHGTLSAASRTDLDGLRVSACSSTASFAIGPITIRPFPVPHDAKEPTQFVFEDGAQRLGVLTDVGRVTSHILDSLAGCDALVMECNHEAALLEASSYPYSLKSRIAGGFGHLSNDAARDIVARLDRSRLRRLVAAHLSRQNNTADLARASLAAATGWSPERIDVADQAAGFGWIDLACDTATSAEH